MDLVDYFLEDCGSLNTGFASFFEFVKDGGKVDLIEDFVDLVIQSDPVLVDIVPLLNEVGQLFTVEIVGSQLHDLVSLLLGPEVVAIHLGHVSEVIRNLGIYEGSQENPLIVV